MFASSCHRPKKKVTIYRGKGEGIGQTDPRETVLAAEIYAQITGH